MREYFYSSTRITVDCALLCHVQDAGSWCMTYLRRERDTVQRCSKEYGSTLYWTVLYCTSTTNSSMRDMTDCLVNHGELCGQFEPGLQSPNVLKLNRIQSGYTGNRARVAHTIAKQKDPTVHRLSSIQDRAVQNHQSFSSINASATVQTVFIFHVVGLVQYSTHKNLADVINSTL
jgi:hypothetical protein